MKDTEIVDLYLRREETAIEHTAKEYSARLRRISLNILNNASDVDECENDTYLSAWKLIPPHEPRTYLFAFLAKIIRNHSINRCKWQHTKKRNTILVELTTEMQECIPAPNSLECRITDDEFGNILSTFLWSLEEEARNVFLRRYWFADSIRDIANRFHMSESKVKSMLFRTRNYMRDYLEKEGYEL